MKCEAKKTLNNIKLLVKLLNINIETHIIDASMYKEAKKWLEFVSNDFSKIYYSINEEGIKVILSNDETFELKFIPSMYYFQKIETKLSLPGLDYIKTMDIKDKTTVIEEKTVFTTEDPSKYFHNNIREYENGELKYAVHYYILGDDKTLTEHFLDGRTLKTAEYKEKNGKYSKRYLKKDFDKPIPLNNRKEELVFNPKEISKKLDECSDEEFTKFVSYWKVINTKVETVNRSLEKRQKNNK